MANSDKDILITPGKDTSNLPEINFVGLDNAPIKLRVLDDNTLSFEGSSGQLFSINNNLTVGTIFSVNDVSGIPAIETVAEGLNYLSPYYGNTIIGPGSKTLTNIDSSDAPLVIGRTQNTTRYDLEVRSNHGLTNGNYGGITFKQQADGAVSLSSIRLEYTNSGHPHIGFYTRSGNAEVRRMHINGNNDGRDGNVGIGAIEPGGAYNQTPARLTINATGSHSGYNALMLTNSTATNTDKGASITGAPYNFSNPPWVGYGQWATSNENIVYLGGGGWGETAEATILRFYSGSGQGISARATHRWTLNSSGHLVPTADNSYNLGDSSNRIATIFPRSIDFTFNTSSGNFGGPNSIRGLDRFVSVNTAQSFVTDMYGQWPQKHVGRFQFRGFTAGGQLGGQYLHIKFNQPMSSNMMFFRAEGYLYGSRNIWARAGCYPYGPSNSILNIHINNSGFSTLEAMYRSSDNFLVLRFNRQSTGYSEGVFDLWVSGHGNSSYAGIDITAVGYTDSTEFF
jgi:hypothetical protein